MAVLELIPVGMFMLHSSDDQNCIAGISIFQYYSQCHIASPTGIAVHTGAPIDIAVLTVTYA
jgi:hypothetical protein